MLMMARERIEEVTIALVQMSMSTNVESNLAKALGKIDEAAEKGAKIVCLPELFASRYFCQDERAENFKFAESIPGKTSAALSDSAKKNKVVIVAGLFEKEGEDYYNSAVVIDADGSLLGTYRKMHIPEDPVGFREKFYFKAGEPDFRSYKTAYARIGVLVCWDQWYPEAARLAALSGAQILFYPTAIGWLPAELKTPAGEEMLSAWETVQRGHGIANEIFIASANRVGVEDEITFWGSSFVSGPFGKILGKGSEKNEEIVIAKCRLGEIEKVRKEWPFFRDRRTDAYKGITSK